MKWRCIECGKEDKLYENLCEHCFLKRNRFIKVPEYLDLRRCTYCGFINKGADWFDVTVEEGIKFSLDKAIIVDDRADKYSYSITFDYEDERNIVCDIKAHIFYQGLSITERHSSKIRIKNDVCARCSKLHGKYYEAIVQVRADGRNLSKTEIKEIKNRINQRIDAMQKSNRNIFLGREEEVRGGMDFYLSSKNAGVLIAKELVQIFGAGFSESSSLFGQKDGKRIYRMTYLVRLPKYHVQDFLVVGDEVVKIIRIRGKAVKFLNLRDWTESSHKPQELENAKVLGGNELIKSAVVISQSKNEIQILDPDEYNTIEILKPKDVEIGDVVNIIKCEKGIFIVP